MFYFKVIFWDEAAQRQKTESGLLTAKDYSEATKKIVDFYCERYLTSMVLEEWEDVLTEDDILEGFEQAD